ncbi:MAG: hypothetical protein L6M37_04370 [Candidatus Methylarchaceae archaeon HK02M1]|nr:hypothetical protein [Candidatus Methylarchaceae archaeon HK01M]MCP8312170.1 hypothetical protein [Candidatus Methylarchaceae archaeon HK02M1]
MVLGMTNEVEPIHAHGFFWVSEEGVVNQTIIFDYYDKKGYYASLLLKPDEYEQEMIKLFHSMQNLLDQEKVLVNGVKYKPKLLTVSLDHRGSENLPCITFLITFRGRIKIGTNTYENFYERGIIEYDYEAYWVFPERTKILEVESSIDYEVVAKNILIMRAIRGDRYSGSERIVFDLR